ncbi:hypothetical protein H2136_20195 [Aeromonas hydrophila]|uniref:Uncharacterized protein n=1 Tax=Aeromonas hydrophila TaxID=644 RepID=A0A926FPP5_AERHY|nr:hypothetical protein [Aeromonas hydrophila]
MGGLTGNDIDLRHNYYMTNNCRQVTMTLTGSGTPDMYLRSLDSEQPHQV